MAIGLISQSEFDTGAGTLLLWRGEAAAWAAQPYAGRSEGVAVLLVAREDALASLRESGPVGLRALVRAGALRPFVLATMDQIEAAGLEDFVEDLGLVFPRH